MSPSRQPPPPSQSCLLLFAAVAGDVPRPSPLSPCFPLFSHLKPNNSNRTSRPRSLRIPAASFAALRHSWFSLSSLVSISDPPSTLPAPRLTLSPSHALPLSRYSPFLLTHKHNITIIDNQHTLTCRRPTPRSTTATQICDRPSLSSAAPPPFFSFRSAAIHVNPICLPLAHFCTYTHKLPQQTTISTSALIGVLSDGNAAASPPLTYVASPFFPRSPFSVFSRLKHTQTQHTYGITTLTRHCGAAVGRGWSTQPRLSIFLVLLRHFSLSRIISLSELSLLSTHTQQQHDSNSNRRSTPLFSFTSLVSLFLSLFFVCMLCVFCAEDPARGHGGGWKLGFSILLIKS